MIDYRLLGFEKGQYDEIPSYAAASAYTYTPAEWQRVLHNRQRTVIGNPKEMQEKLVGLAAEFDVDEIVISTFTERVEDRLRSYEWMAELFGLERQSTHALPAGQAV